MNNRFEFEITAYDNVTGNNISLDLSPVQVKAIQTILGIQFDNDEFENLIYRQFDDAFVLRLLHDFENRWKSIE